MLKKLWNDEAGFVTLEYLFGATILVIGMTVGLVFLKNSINAELVELGQAITSLNQSYSFNGEQFGCASTAGSAATDTTAANTSLTSVTPTSGNTAAVSQAVCP